MHLTGSESSLSSLARSTAAAFTNNPIILASVTTPVPDTNPLDGGILLEEPYATDAYDRFPGDESYLAFPYRGAANHMPRLVDSPKDKGIPEEILAAFDTNKVAMRGTLQRRHRVKNHKGEDVDDQSDIDTEDHVEDGKHL